MTTHEAAPVSEARRAYLDRVRRNKRLVLACQLGFLIAFFVLWEVLAQVGVIDSFILSQPSRIWHTLTRFSENKLLLHIGVTVYETLTGFLLGVVIGVFAVNFIAMEMYGWALLAIVLNRFCDGLDGAVARSTKVTDFGVFLDAALDYIFYGGVILAFALANPAENALSAACMLFGFAAAGCAMLAYSVND